MAKSTDKQTIKIEARCGNCAAWTPAEPVGPVTIGEPRRGVCRGCPPTPAALYDPTGKLYAQKDLRPQPPENEYCLLFTVRADLIPGGTAQH